RRRKQICKPPRDSCAVSHRWTNPFAPPIPAVAGPRHDCKPPAPAADASPRHHATVIVMARSARPGVCVARVGELRPGQTKKFLLQFDGREEECFVVNHRGTLYAYINRCCHVPMSLDWIENQFMTEDGAYIQCATHGAQYLPDSGECVWGPPCGRF